MDVCMSSPTVQLDGGFMCRNLQDASDHSTVFLRKRVQRRLILKCWKLYEDARRQFNMKLPQVAALASQMNWAVCRQTCSQSECQAEAKNAPKFQVRYGDTGDPGCILKMEATPSMKDDSPATPHRSFSNTKYLSSQVGTCQDYFVCTPIIFPGLPLSCRNIVKGDSTCCEVLQAESK